MKGQLFSYDLLLASVFVIFLMALFLLSLESVLSGIDSTELRGEMQEAVQTAADSLVRTPGNPSNWELQPIGENGTRSLGLANSPGELDPAKVAAFFSIGNTSTEYNATLPILGLQRRIYYYNATLESLDGSALYSLQRFPSGSPPQTVSVERLARLNGTPVRFTMVVWRE